MISVHDLSYTYPEQEAPALSGISLQAGPGECICITGHSGCGKSTLLLAIKGLLHEGLLEGEILLNGRPLTEKERLSGLGIVFQNAESQILCATVFDEVAFGPENLCIPPDEINTRIIEALTAVDLLTFGNRNVERFSAGQKQRLCIAAVLSMHPRILLLDEPTSQLDRKGRDDLLDILGRLKALGISIIFAEHSIEPFIEIIDRYYIMKDGRITVSRDTPPEEYLDNRHLHACLDFRDSPAPAAGKPLMSAEQISLAYPDREPVLNEATLSIMPGELVHLHGENGCGKSTLLKTMAGALQPDSGRMLFSGRNVPTAGGLLGKVALLFQNPQIQLFEDTVADEVAFTLKRLNLPEEEIAHRVQSALSLCEASHLSTRLPLTLSYGEQHRVALASLIAPEPGLLLLDEPFAGLDPTQRLRLLKILAQIREERGTAVLIASHDPLPDPEWADRIITMQDGKIFPPEDRAR